MRNILSFGICLQIPRLGKIMPQGFLSQRANSLPFVPINLSRIKMVLKNQIPVSEKVKVTLPSILQIINKTRLLLHFEESLFLLIQLRFFPFPGIFQIRFPCLIFSRCDFSTQFFKTASLCRINHLLEIAIQSRFGIFLPKDNISRRFKLAIFLKLPESIGILETITFFLVSLKINLIRLV